MSFKRRQRLAHTKVSDLLSQSPEFYPLLPHRASREPPHTLLSSPTRPSSDLQMSATSPLQCCYCNSALPPNDLADSSLQNAPISASTSFVSSPSPLPNPEMSYISIPTSTATSTSIRPSPNSPTNSSLKSTLTSIPLPSNVRAQKLYVDELLKLR